MAGLVYYQRRSFLTLELHASSDWQLHLQTRIAIAFNWCDVLSILQARVETTVGYNTITHQTTFLQPRMFHSIKSSKGSEVVLKKKERKTMQLQSTISYNPVLTSLYLYARQHLRLYYTPNDH